MNIIFFTRLYYPHIGGVEKHVKRLAETLTAQKHKLTIITEQYSSQLPEHETKNNITILRILVPQSAKHKKFYIWKWILLHRKLFIEADILHVHDVVFWLYPFKLLRPRTKIFATFHGWEGIFPIPFLNIVKRMLDAHLCSGNICIGDYISKWYHVKPSIVSYGAVDINVQKRVVLPRNKLLFLGRLDKDTGYTECIQRYNNLKPKLNWSLTVAGNGPLRVLKPKDSMYLGFIKNPYKEMLSAKYIYTTGYLGILEALYLKKPVLCSYDNPVKKDYLLMHPMSKYFIFDSEVDKKINVEAFEWAQKQTWEKLSNCYLELWSK